jgi:hypothetical protein
MTEIEYLAELQSAAAKLGRDEIDVEKFEHLCVTAATGRYGPPPEGREYVAGLVGTRLVVGHREKPKPPSFPNLLTRKPS